MAPVHTLSRRGLTIAALVIAGCSTDQFIEGDAGTDATNTSDGNSDATTLDGEGADALVDAGCLYAALNSGSCPGTSCASDLCCVSADATACTPTVCVPPAIALHCSRASDCDGGVCCLENITGITITSCPRTVEGASLTSTCTSVGCESLNDGGPAYVRMCDGKPNDCVGVGQTCQWATFALNPNADFGVCQ